MGTVRNGNMNSNGQERNGNGQEWERERSGMGTVRNVNENRTERALERCWNERITVVIMINNTVFKRY